MPIYEYECIHCQHRFEVRQGYKDKPQAKCPKCQETARRIFHPTPIIFKGSGFYITDHRPAEGGAKPTKSQGEAEGGAKPTKSQGEADSSAKPTKSKGEAEASQSTK